MSIHSFIHLLMLHFSVYTGTGQPTPWTVRQSLPGQATTDTNITHTTSTTSGSLKMSSKTNGLCFLDCEKKCNAWLKLMHILVKYTVCMSRKTEYWTMTCLAVRQEHNPFIHCVALLFGPTFRHWVMIFCHQPLWFFWSVWMRNTSLFTLPQWLFSGTAAADHNQ